MVVEDGAALLQEAGLDYLSVVLSATCSLAVLILALVLCTCKEKPSSESNNATLENIEKRKSRISAEVKQEVSLTDVQVDGEVTKRQSNGAVSGGRNSSNSRPRSHDRALPDIPGVPGLPGETEEEENDPNYDVIVKQKATVAQRIQKEVAASVSKNHPYEKVKVVERPYEEVDSVKGKAEGGASATPEEEVYAGARSEGGGSDYYASVNECGIEYSKRDGTKEVIKTKVVSQESKEVEDTTYAPVPGPPVPKKNFEPITIETTANNSISPPSPQALPQQSPELPPRNALGQAMWSSTEAITSPGSSEGAAAIVTSPGSPPVDAGTSSAAAPPAANADKKDPKYSKVTARESLQHMRDRVAQMEQNSTVQYDYIKYGDVKSITTGAAPAPQVMQRESMNSELYAEIVTASASQRSSTYARVGDQRDPSAPAPPSVDILHNLSHKETTEESNAEPPYSKVSKQVPEPQVVTNRDSGQDPSQLYAQVDKERKRSTIHVDSDVEGQVGAPGSADHMYAKVDKNNKRRSGDSSNMIGASTSTSAPQGFGGARPKVTSSQSSDPVPGYASVRDRDSVPGYERVVIQNGNPVIPDAEVPDPGYSMVTATGNGPVSIDIDPNYSVVGSGTGANSDYDPNYETVHLADGEAGRTVEIKSGGQWSRPVADPVYQEIPEEVKKQRPPEDVKKQRPPEHVKKQKPPEDVKKVKHSKNSKKR